MVSLGYVRSALSGCLALAARKENWRDYFDLSSEGFFRSFYAALFGAPLAVVVSLLDFQSLRTRYDEMGQAEAFPSLGAHAFFEVLFYGAAWAVVPLAMIPITRILSRTQHYSPFVITYNWTQLLFLLFGVTIQYVSLLGDPGRVIASLAILCMMIFGVYMMWTLTRRTLLVSVFQTIAVAIILSLVTLLLNTMKIMILYPHLLSEL